MEIRALLARSVSPLLSVVGRAVARRARLGFVVMDQGEDDGELHVEMLVRLGPGSLLCA
jgi:hypothetical protein